MTDPRIKSRVKAAPAPTSEEDAQESAWIDILLLCAPLAVAAIDTGTGSYVAGASILILGLRWAFRRPFELIEMVVVITAALVLASPLWNDVTTSWSPSRGAAIAVLFVLPVRWVIQSERDFVRAARVVALLCTGYAAYFLMNSSAIDTIGVDRLTVDFANANYTGAVLAFGAIAALWIATTRTQGRRLRIVYLTSAALQAWVVYDTGSRASFAGLVLGAAVLVVIGRRMPQRVSRWTFAAMVAGFFVGFYPGAAALFRSASEPLTGLGSTFGRGQDALYTVSGRDQIWADTRDAASQSWIVGWGPGTYQFQHRPPYVAAHSWGLEYVASVGVLGTAFLAVLLVMCYFERGRGPGALPLRTEGKVWNAATALALLPNLVLSTHQWTLWAWFGFAMWSRASVLQSQGAEASAGQAGVFPVPDDEPQGAGREVRRLRGHDQVRRRGVQG